MYPLGGTLNFRKMAELAWAVNAAPPFQKHYKAMSNTPSIPNPYEAMIAVILEEVQKRLDKAVVEIKESVKAMNMPDEQRALSVKEAAKLLGVHRHTIMTMIKRSDLEAKRTGAKYLIPRKSLREYVEKNRPEAAHA